MGLIKLILIFLLTGISMSSIADIPAWAKKDTIKKNGSILMSICQGTGPSQTLARKDAINNCLVSARQFLNSEINIKTLSTETEKSVGFHQEIEESGLIKKLVCTPKRDETIEKDSQFQVWIECQFDLRAVVHTSTNEVSESRNPVERDNLTTVKASPIVKTDSDNFEVTLMVVPKCDSVLIRGKKLRSINCDSNPLKIVADNLDTQIIVRANGFQSKTIKITNEVKNETVQIFLERN
jgi:hypothetical protein